MNPITIDDPRVRRAISTVLAAADAMSWEPSAGITREMLERAEARGYFLPEEDERIRHRYQSFLASRAALLQVLGSMEEACGPDETVWKNRTPAFVAGLAAACVLNAGSRDLLGLARESRLLRKKLDEPDSRHGIPRKTFARLYRAAASLRRQAKFLQSLAFFHGHRSEFEALKASGELAEILDVLDRQAVRFQGLSTSGLFKEQLGYRLFSFRRRHHSGWKKAVFGVFEGSGRAIADLRQPGMRTSSAEKRVTSDLRERALAMVRPGDVFITRHDDAMSNLFLPGFWPHAAFYVGSPEERQALGVEFPQPLARSASGKARFLEAKKDGVRFRPAEETLAVDCFVVLRPPLETEQIAEAISRAAGHAGKLYDFVFDFRSSDRLVCTEVIYRAYDGCGPLAFQLEESGGRLCLPAEDLITQALAKSFEVVLTCGLEDGGILRGQEALRALEATRA